MAPSRLPVHRELVAAGRFAAEYHVWWKLAVCLALFTAWVHWWFVPYSLAPRYRDGLPILRDRTLGTNLAVLFELLPQPPEPEDVLVSLVGDSTIGGALQDENVLAWKLREALRARYPGRRVDVVDMSLIGLRAPEALIFVAKALSLRPSLVVYAVSPRVAPVDVELSPSVRDMGLEPAIVARVGLPAVLELIAPASVAQSLVHSFWLPARLRVELRDAALGRFGIHWRRAGASAASSAAREGSRMVQAVAQGGYLWPRASYALDPPNTSTRALEALIRLCGEERACLLYHVPVNPLAEHGFEPGVMDGFLDWIGGRSAEAGVPFADYHTAASPSQFRTNTRGDRDAIHLTAAGLDAFAPMLAGAVVDRLDARGR